MKLQDWDALNTLRETGRRKLFPGKPRVAVGMGTCGIGNGARDVYEAFEREIQNRSADVRLTQVGCFGFCAMEPLVNIHLPGQPLVVYADVKPGDVGRLLDAALSGEPAREGALCKIEKWDHHTTSVSYGYGLPEIPAWHEIPFYAGQQKIVLRNCGLINPEDIDEYIAIGGYEPLHEVLSKPNPDEIIQEIKKSKLRGRGGAGYPTGLKWEFIRKAEADQKYLVCNADEGDPGAYMNRNEIESDPHMLVEGMLIGGYATGASEGVIYARAEYPLAVSRLKKAIDDAREYGLLGKNILGSGFDFDLFIVEGAGAFVCGEETALLASIEGRAGRPRPRPPFPAEKGLWDKPANINNVETWCNIPVIIAKGAAWFAQTGTSRSTGTKVFSLVGKVANTGLVELPLGTPLQKIVYDIGGGTGTDRKVKAIQTGGPSGGCIPPKLFNTPVDYESLAALGSIMGSGGMVVMDTDNCMVDVARYFLEFTTSESCGKCIPCRDGLQQASRLLKHITRGQAHADDIERLEDLGTMIRDSSLCGLGQTGPNPLLTTLKYFRREYEQHIQVNRCYSGVCQEIQLSPCENSCPLHMNIPRFLQLLSEDKLDEAFESVLLDNPLPAITGRVCEHPCSTRCRRAERDEAVGMREVHRFIVDRMYSSDQYDAAIQRIIDRKLAPTGKRISIIGAGPAGLAAAYYLLLLGHEVMLYDLWPEPGGIMRWAIPEYRIPHDVMKREMNVIERLGVQYVGNTRIPQDISLDRLKEDYDAVFLAIGAGKGLSPGITGEELDGVYPGISFLEQYAAGKDVQLGKHVVVIGGGNVAIDSARTCRRLGADVTIVYRRAREDMPAIAEEVNEAEEEGVHLLYMTGINAVLGDANGKVTGIEAVKAVPGDFDTSGRRRPILTDETYKIPCDTVILSVGEKVDSEFTKAAQLTVNSDGTVVINEFTFETGIPKLYAGGDLVNGPSNVTEAMATGKRAAEVIDEHIMQHNRWKQVFREFTYSHTAPAEPWSGPKHRVDYLPVHQRLNSFEEVSLGLGMEEARHEAQRCLRCDVKEL